MARNKTKIAYITSDVTRRRTFERRKRNLIKKVDELSVLCGVQSCALVTAPGEPNQPEIWPSIVDADKLIAQLRDLPSLGQDKQTLDQARFLSKGNERLKEQLKKVEKENREAEVKVALMRCLGGEGVQTADLDEVGSLAEGKVRAVAERIEWLTKSLCLAPLPAVDLQLRL
ncbi:Agamous-like MADS-box protein AGL80 [Acorus gramineus]|uniref:Agamous-like MADS-box protein AGL80 n=1 Tax=Acorus gramineus TaxID=55184 RepID=A0AAV9BPG0_ACOGR|nr:Agamous-like MADS-box protein AGL80 [Acorus gramineus]